MFLFFRFACLLSFIVVCVSRSLPLDARMSETAGEHVGKLTTEEGSTGKGQAEKLMARIRESSLLGFFMQRNVAAVYYLGNNFFTDYEAPPMFTCLTFITGSGMQSEQCTGQSKKATETRKSTITRRERGFDN